MNMSNERSIPTTFFRLISKELRTEEFVDLCIFNVSDCCNIRFCTDKIVRQKTSAKSLAHD